MCPWSNSLFHHTRAWKPQQVISWLSPTPLTLLLGILGRELLDHKGMYILYSLWSLLTLICSSEHPGEMLSQSPFLEMAIETASLPTFLPELATISQFHSANVIGSFLFITETVTNGSCQETRAYEPLRRQQVGADRSRPLIYLSNLLHTHLGSLEG